MLNARLGLQTSSQNCFFLGCFLGRVQYCDLVENRIEYGSSSLPDMVLQNSSQSWCTRMRALRHRPCSITEKQYLKPKSSNQPGEIDLISDIWRDIKIHCSSVPQCQLFNAVDDPPGNAMQPDTMRAIKPPENSSTTPLMPRLHSSAYFADWQS